jgi:predicted molibdopterin-dependent oxidoreductase YjgC
MNARPDRTPEPPPRCDWLRRADIDRPGATIVMVTVDGTPVQLHEGDSVAAAVLLAGLGVYRTTIVGEAPRAPFCMMGVCFDCLVEIDGIPNRQGCLIPVRNGMEIVRQLGLPAKGPVAR